MLQVGLGPLIPTVTGTGDSGQLHMGDNGSHLTAEHLEPAKVLKQHLP